MPRERPVQAQAELGERYRAQGGPAVSPWLVAGIVVLALSLVAIGALVVVRSLRGDLPGVARAPDPTPTPARPTPGVFTVGKQGEGPTPTTSNEGSSGARHQPAGQLRQRPAHRPGAAGRPAVLARPRRRARSRKPRPHRRHRAPSASGQAQPPGTSPAPASRAGPSPATAGSPAPRPRRKSRPSPRRWAA